MGEPKLLERFRQFCKEYNAEYAFEGEIEGFDIVDLVPPERLTRGISVHTDTGTRYVQLNPERKPPIGIGETIIVVGRNGWRGENSVSPAVILHPAGRDVFFSRDLRPRSRRSLVLWNLPWVIALAAIILQWNLMPQQVWIPVLGLSFFVIASCTETLVVDYGQRPKSFNCDEHTWLALTAEIENRFEIKI
jgi:hypothetical protein